VTAPGRGLEKVRAALDAYRGASADDAGLDLLVGTPCFAPPDALTAAMRQAATTATFDYSSNQGTLALREAIVQVRAALGESWGPEHVFVTHGAKVAALAVLGTLLRPGDEVVVPVPAYGPYRALPGLFGARLVPVEREPPRFAFDSDRIAAAIGTRTRVVLLASPCNPTGAVLDPEAERGLHEVARSRGAVLVLDRAYEWFRQDPGDATPVSAAGPEGPVRLHSFSKTYGLCGWRMGYVLGASDLVERLTAFQASNLNPPNTLVQRALEAVPAVPASFHEAAAGQVRLRVAALRAALEAGGLSVAPPAGGFYLFADARDAMRRTGLPDSAEFCRRLAAEVGLALTPGTDFGIEGWVRASAVALLDPDAAGDVTRRLRAFAA